MVKKEEIAKVLGILAKKEGLTMLARLRQKYDPFKVLISTILSARAKDEVTEIIADRLLRKYPTPKALAAANPAVVQKIIKPIGFYRNKTKSVIGAAKKLLSDFDGKVPNDMDALLELPGVGRKVAGCVMVYSFGNPAIPVDVHVHRISNRLGWVKTKTPAQTEKELLRIIPKKHWMLVNEAFVVHGKTVCNPITPLCSKCPIFKYCKRAGVKRSK